MASRRKPDVEESSTLRREVAYDRLRSEIIRGVIPPGASLQEEELSRRLAISRTPVREAIRRLAEEGLVEVLPYRGARVVNPDIEQMLQVFEAREAIEGMAARLAAERAKELDTAEIRKALKARLVEVRKQPAKFNPPAADFHETVLRASGNHLLGELARRLYARVLIGRVAAALVRTRLVESAQEHIEILEAIRIGDGDRAERLMRRHIRLTWDNLLSCLQEVERSHQASPWSKRASFRS